MHIDTNRFPRTVDGHDYRVLATDLGGDLPIAIFVNGEVARLNREYKCPANDGYSLNEPRRTSTKFVNFYRAADGTFTPGKGSYNSNDERLALRDSQRAVFALQITFDENTGSVSARPV